MIENKGILPAKYFRRSGNALAGISSAGIKEIKSKNIKSISLPTEIDGHKIERLVFDCLTCLKDVPEIEELIVPGELVIQGLTTTSGQYCYDFPNTETIKRLVFTGKTDINFYRHISTFDESLESITIQKSDRFVSLDGVVFSKDKTTLVYYPRSKRKKKYNVPSGVKEIRNSSFNHVKNLEEIVLPESLESVSKNAFQECSIKRIEIPGSVEIIWEDAFSSCELESVVLHEGLRWIDKGAFQGCTANEVIFPSSLERIGERAFSNSKSKFVFQTDDITVEKGAFSNCRYWQFAGASRKMRRIIIGTSFTDFPYLGSDQEVIRNDAINRIKILCGEEYQFNELMPVDELKVLFLQLLDEYDKENDEASAQSVQIEEPTFTPEKASQIMLRTAQSKDSEFTGEAMKYVTSISDEIVDAFLHRIKNEHNRRATIDAGNLCPIMDRVPMTKKLYEAYTYFADYKDWDYRMPTEHAQRIRKSMLRFALYRLTGHVGEVQREAAYDVGCYITGPMPSKFSFEEDKVREWLKKQIEAAIKNGKRLFITKTSIGISCLAAEIVIEFQQKYSGIKLVLLRDKEYETENTGLGHWNRLVGNVVYEQKPTEASLRWAPRLAAVKQKADLTIYELEGDRYDNLGERIEFPVWITDHCSRIITTWKKAELADQLLYNANKKGVEIVSYQRD